MGCYQFSAKIKSNNALPGITLKEDKKGIYVKENVSVEAVVTAEGTAAEDVENLDILIDFGAAPEGTVIELSDVVFRDASCDDAVGPGEGDGLNSAELLDVDGERIAFAGANMKANFTAGETYVLTLDRTGEKAALKAETLAEHNAASGLKGIRSVTNADSAFYSLTGVRVAQPKTGLYIKNSKKVLVR